jgi:hypothetical protein
MVVDNQVQSKLLLLFGVCDTKLNTSLYIIESQGHSHFS